jgi:hypothetical protein
VAYMYSAARGPKLISARDIAGSTSECKEYQVDAFFRQSRTVRPEWRLYTTYIDTSVTAVTVNCVDN